MYALPGLDLGVCCKICYVLKYVIQKMYAYARFCVYTYSYTCILRPYQGCEVVMKCYLKHVSNLQHFYEFDPVCMGDSVYQPACVLHVV